MAKVTQAASVLALCAVIYGFGLYCGYEHLWPVTQVRLLVEARSESSVRTDRYGRLLDYPGKTEVPCPSQDTSTAVLLVFGQSNAANYQGQRYVGLDGHVLNLSEGRCYIASSPLLGADGSYGESWTLLGNKLVASGIFQKVILIPAGVGGSSIRRWAAGGELNQMVLSVVRDAKLRYAITAMLWHQGSADYALHTPQQRYESDLRSLIESLRAEGITAPFYVSRSSLAQTAGWSPDNQISRAQAAIVDNKLILAGPDTDRDVTAVDRYDGLHLSASGQQIFTDDWVGLLRAHKPQE